MDIRLFEVVVRNGSNKGPDHENFTFYVLIRPKCASVSSEAILDRAKLHQYLNDHWQSHKPGENLTKDQIVDKFGIPISDAISGWFKSHQNSKKLMKE